MIALQGESALRLLSGLLTIYLAFYVESTAHGLEAAVQLGAVIGAAGVGNFSGTAIGIEAEAAAPELVIVVSVVVTAATASSSRSRSASPSPWSACTSAPSATRCPRSPWTR